MGFVSSKLPPPDEVVELPASDLGLRLLRLIVEEQQGHLLTRSVVANRSYWADEIEGEAVSAEFLAAMAEAWDWLIFNRLVAMRPDEGSFNGHAYVTRRGERAAADARADVLLRAEARIDVDLHPRLADKIPRQFLLGEYELAAFAAMREVEIRVRELVDYPHSAIGVKLMRDAFHPERGPLADAAREAGERQATADLFAGAIGVFKNPSSHREVDFQEPTLASEVILFADLLLRMLDARQESPTG